MNEQVDLLLKTLRIYSPTYDEQELGYYLHDKLRSYGYYVRTDKAGNVIAKLGKGKPSILLCGHMDTVPGRIKVRLQGGRIYGRGASDAKGPLCCLVSASRRFLDSDSLRITLALVTREEGDSLGINTLIKEEKNFDYAIFGEPSGAANITVGYRGRLPFEIKILTKGGHAASPWAHKNAIEVSFKLINLLRNLERNYSGKNNFYSLSIAPTILRSGSYHNVIPSSSRIFFDVRVPPGKDIYKLKKDIESLLSGIKEDTVKCDVVFLEHTDPYEVNLNSPLVRAFQRAILLRLNRKPKFVKKTGTGDMNTFASLTKVESVTYGPGNSSLSHTKDEYIEIDDYLDSIVVLEEALRQLADFSSKQP